LAIRSGHGHRSDVLWVLPKPHCFAFLKLYWAAPLWSQDGLRSDLGTSLGWRAGDQVKKRTRLGMASNIYHWGLHPWADLWPSWSGRLALFQLSEGSSLTIRSEFYPILSNVCFGAGRSTCIESLRYLPPLLWPWRLRWRLGSTQANAGLKTSSLWPASRPERLSVLLITGITADWTVFLCFARYWTARVKIPVRVNMGLAFLAAWCSSFWWGRTWAILFSTFGSFPGGLCRNTACFTPVHTPLAVEGR